MTPESTMMSQIKGTFVRSQPTNEIYIFLNIGLCSVFSFLSTIFLCNWDFLFVLSILLSELTFVFFLTSLMITNWYTSILIFLRYLVVACVKTIVHTNVWYQTSNKFGELIEYILDMKKQYFNEILHRRYSRMDKKFMNTFRDQVLGNPRLNVLKIFPEWVYIRSYQQIKMADIINIMCLSPSPKRLSY